MGNRDVSIDMCKGLGMLLVVLGHLPFLFCSVIYSFHMGFFLFFLDGVFPTDICRMERAISSAVSLDSLFHI